MPQSPLDQIRSIASKYPEAERTFLLGDHVVFRVRKKVFVWLGTAEDGGTYVSVKLKDSQHAALMLPFVSPAGYGMTKWGWIAATFPRGKLPLELLTQWIDESYRHTAPKRLLHPQAPSARAIGDKRRRRRGNAKAPRARKSARRSAKS
jgi:predicted DNA-binding protein (MmcQ/YjbR family)